MAEKVKELERSVAEERRKLEEANDQEKGALMQKQRELEERLAKQMEETELLLKKREEEERQDDLLQEHLLRAIPLVGEANSIGRELQKNIVFSLKVMSGEWHSDAQKLLFTLHTLNHYQSPHTFNIFA